MITQAVIPLLTITTVPLLRPAGRASSGTVAKIKY